jgi:hypothetical protein
MDLVFITGALALLVAVVLSLCIKEVPLRRVSGMDLTSVRLVRTLGSGDLGEGVA